MSTLSKKLFLQGFAPETSFPRFGDNGSTHTLRGFLYSSNCLNLFNFSDIGNLSICS